MVGNRFLYSSTPLEIHPSRVLRNNPYLSAAAFIQKQIKKASAKDALFTYYLFFVFY